MAISILPKTRTLIPSSFVVRALAIEGPRYHCHGCGDVMFVRHDSGLCPWCFNGEGAWHGVSPREVPHELVLAGVLDDPVVEDEAAV